jgi:hypothetical protein
MAWQPIASAPVDGTDILVRRLEFDNEGGLQAAWHSVAAFWIGLWVFHYGATSQPIQLRFEPLEWQPIDDELPDEAFLTQEDGRVGATRETEGLPALIKEDENATGLGEAEARDAGSESGPLDAGDPEVGG